jgi:hypothetical protein
MTFLFKYKLSIYVFTLKEVKQMRTNIATFLLLIATPTAFAGPVRCLSTNRQIALFGINDAKPGYVEAELYDNSFGAGTVGVAGCGVSVNDKRGLVAACSGNLEGLDQAFRIRIYKDLLNASLVGFIQVFKKGTVPSVNSTYPLICQGE